MGIDLHIENEQGKTINSLSDDQNLFMHIINQSDMSSYSLLKYIDPYGDSVFNILQLHDLIIDFSILYKTISENETKNYLNNVITILKEYKNSNHIYFKFYGD